MRFGVIGGIAAQLHDLAVPATIDIDVTPARDNKNLQRLAKAFDELEAGLATANDAGSWFPRHPVKNWAQYDIELSDRPVKNNANCPRLKSIASLDATKVVQPRMRVPRSLGCIAKRSKGILKNAVCKLATAE